MGRAAFMTRSGLSAGSATCLPATSRTGTTLPHKACREKSTGAVPFLTRQTASSAGRHGKTGNGSNLSETNRGKAYKRYRGDGFPKTPFLSPPSLLRKNGASHANRR